jgi:hypothetical protein
MANVFAILSAIALAAAAFLAMKNKDAYKNEIGLRQQEQARNVKLTAEYNALVDEFNTTETERKSTETETVSLREQETAETKKNNELEAQKDAKDKEAKANQEKIGGIEEQLKEFGSIEELVDKLKGTQEALEGLDLDIASATAKQADLTSEKVRTEGVVNAYNVKNTNYSSKKSFFGSTRISAIYPAYGFVTLPVGGTAGVVSGSALDVVRDGSVVAKLRVSSVEAGRAAAQIVPDTVAEGTTLMVGDRVVPGSEPAAK